MLLSEQLTAVQSFLLASFHLLWSQLRAAQPTTHGPLVSHTIVRWYGSGWSALIIELGMIAESGCYTTFQSEVAERPMAESLLLPSS